MSEFDTPEFTLEGHLDTVTGLSLSPDGQYLLSNSMDSTLRVWDIRSFASNQNQRCVNILNGVHHGAEKLLLKCAWSADQEYITSGSADRIVHLWESTNYKEVCGWPGHKASINEVRLVLFFMVNFTNFFYFIRLFFIQKNQLLCHVVVISILFLVNLLLKLFRLKL